MQIVNCTPHEINIFDESETVIISSIPPSGIIPRCETIECHEETILFNGFDINIESSSMTNVIDLPEARDNTLFIVSRVVAENSNRQDLIIPNKTVRNGKGQIIGCKSFAKIRKD